MATTLTDRTTITVRAKTLDDKISDLGYDPDTLTDAEKREILNDEKIRQLGYDPDQLTDEEKEAILNGQEIETSDSEETVGKLASLLGVDPDDLSEEDKADLLEQYGIDEENAVYDEDGNLNIPLSKVRQMAESLNDKGYLDAESGFGNVAVIKYSDLSFPYTDKKHGTYSDIVYSDNRFNYRIKGPDSAHNNTYIAYLAYGGKIYATGYPTQPGQDGFWKSGGWQGGGAFYYNDYSAAGIDGTGTPSIIPVTPVSELKRLNQYGSLSTTGGELQSAVNFSGTSQEIEDDLLAALVDKGFDISENTETATQQKTYYDTSVAYQDGTYYYCTDGTWAKDENGTLVPASQEASAELREWYPMGLSDDVSGYFYGDSTSEKTLSTTETTKYVNLGQARDISSGLEGL